jgi:hypothetical protein
VIKWRPFPKIGATYRLNPVERWLAEHIGAERQNARVGAESKNVRRNPAVSDQDMHRNGMGGELAFCALHNCYPDLTIGSTRAEDDMVAGGILVDVKARPAQWHDLPIMPEKGQGSAESVDVYALMIGEFPGPYRFAGVIGRAEAVNDSHFSPNGLKHGPVWLVKQSELIDLNTWIAGRLLFA